jgi:hypothetical protein
MDVTEDTRLQELKEALASYPQEEPRVESENISSWSLDNLSGITALTTLDLSQLTSASIQAFPNTSVQLGSGTTTTWTGGGGGGGGSGLFTTPNVYTINNGSATSGVWSNSGTGTIQIKADDIEIKGKSLMAALNRIEAQLGILDCSEVLEEDWAELKSLGEQYRRLQQHIEEKMKTFETLKK